MTTDSYFYSTIESMFHVRAGVIRSLTLLQMQRKTSQQRISTGFLNYIVGCIDFPVFL